MPLLPSCYGLAERFPTSESAEIVPEYPYALTKNIGEQLVMHWAKLYKLKSVSTRFLMFLVQDQELRVLMELYLEFSWHKRLLDNH